MKTPKPHRYLSRDGHINVERSGWGNWHPEDWYHWLLMVSWTKLSLLVTCAYFILNLLFAFLYSLDSHGLTNARPDHFSDFFFFSVQTLTTIGYGRLTPVSFYTNCVVTLESLIGICNIGLITGLLFSRLSRPDARVMFSHYILVGPFDGKPTLMFRAANRRGNQILQAEIHVSLARNVKTLEGDDIRRFYDLKLTREYSPFFSLPWMVRHLIDETSPLYGVTPEQIRESETEFVVLLSGIDDVFGQTVHGRFAYNHEEILFNHRFIDMFRRDEKNHPIIDYDKFDGIEPVAVPLAIPIKT